MIKNKHCKILILFILFFFVTLKVEAISIKDGGTSLGTNNPCNLNKDKKIGYIACYSPKYQFRVTLVDANGNKVEGTSSVDFTYSTNKKTNDITNTKRNLLVNENYKYKYGENESGTFKYIEAPIITNKISLYRDANGKDTAEKYDEFYNDFHNVFSSRTDLVNYPNSETKTDFISLFLNEAGYLKERVKLEESDRFNEFKDKDYYLLIEPTYDIYYNDTYSSTKLIYKYGTASELAEFIYNEITGSNESTPELKQEKINKYNKGYLSGLTLNFVYQIACNMHTPDNEIVKSKDWSFSKIQEYADCERFKAIDSTQEPFKAPNNYLPKDDRPAYILDVFNKEYGYAASVVQLSEIFGEDQQFTFNIDLCADDDGKLSLEHGINADDIAVIKNDYFKVSEGLYCIDNVSYDFSDIIEKFNNQKLDKLLKIDEFTIPKGIVTINRTCLITNASVTAGQVVNYRDYPNEIVLTIFGKTKKLVKSPEIISDCETSNETWLGEKQIDCERKIIYTYNHEKDEYLSLESTAPNIGYIDLSSNKVQNMFGYSNNMLNAIINAPGNILSVEKNIDYEISKNFTLDYNGENNLPAEEKLSEALKCNFKYSVSDEEPLGDDLQFRTISLSNPFPARDGTSRLPGTNWLNKENYVYDYINNNRAIQYKRQSTTDNPELMYLETEPMYTVTLDPATMMKIRQYNSQNTYDYINLACNKDNRECQSIFLRNTYFIPSDNLSGVCSDSSNFHKVVETIDENIKEEDVRKAIYSETYKYNSKYDFNKNYRMDTEDLEIFLNKEKNTGFYTCADKTYKSGG